MTTSLESLIQEMRNIDQRMKADVDTRTRLVAEMEQLERNTATNRKKLARLRSILDKHIFQGEDIVLAKLADDDDDLYEIQLTTNQFTPGVVTLNGVNIMGNTLVGPLHVKAKP